MNNKYKILREFVDKIKPQIWKIFIDNQEEFENILKECCDKEMYGTTLTSSGAVGFNEKEIGVLPDEDNFFDDTEYLMLLQSIQDGKEFKHSFEMPVLWDNEKILSKNTEATINVISAKDVNPIDYRRVRINLLKDAFFKGEFRHPKTHKVWKV